MSTCVHATVQGRVQGVGFRYYTQVEARKLGIFGWVRNCSDGSVEVLVGGDCAQVETLKQWLRHGPGYAQVTQIEFSAGHLPDNCNDFRIV